MASNTLTPASSSVNLLAYLRSKTSIDVDCLDLNVATDLGPFADCTSNQWEAHIQLCKSPNGAFFQKSLTLARQIRGDFVSVSVEELAVEIFMISLSLRMIPFISGSIHVMCNPLYSWDTDKIIETGHRFHQICGILEPEFDTSRIIMKVPATWEGLQACRRLTADGIKTLATTVFTMEQAILAGEAGCISISPFAHELRAHLDTSYHDSAPILDLYLEAQRYYSEHQIPTKVKSCAYMTTDEIISMAGVDAMTLPGEVLAELSAMSADSVEGLEARSVFLRGAGAQTHPPAPSSTRLSYIDDKDKFYRNFTVNGRGKAKTEDSISVFCTFQIQAEALAASASTSSSAPEQTPAHTATAANPPPPPSTSALTTEFEPESEAVKNVLDDAGIIKSKLPVALTA